MHPTSKCAAPTRTQKRKAAAEILEPLRSSAAMSDSEEESGASSGLVTSSELPLWGCSDAFTDPANRDEPVIMGIDEAGRGPVLGPMVYGSAFCFLKDEARMKAMGFMDSKQLTETKREELWRGLKAAGYIGWNIRVLQAAEISGGMLRHHAKYNLNAMSHDTAINLVRQVLDAGVNLKYLYVDTVGDPERYQAKLADIFPTVNVTVAKKADSIYPIVSAASICAKVPRDVLLREWKFEDGRMRQDFEWGCGYPGDKNTVRWLQENLHPVFGWPDVVRFSWAPAMEPIDKNPQAHGAVVFKWPDEEDDHGGERAGMAAFLGGGGGAKKRKLDRHKLLTESKLEPVTTWS